MKKMFTYIIPMRRLGFDFTDKVSGKSVHRWQERLTGRIVMAEGRMSLFRVEVAPPPQGRAAPKQGET